VGPPVSFQSCGRPVCVPYWRDRSDKSMAAMNDLRIVDVPESRPEREWTIWRSHNPAHSLSGHVWGEVAHMSKAAGRSLEELQASILFAADFPRRITYTHAEYLELLNARIVGDVRAPGSRPSSVAPRSGAPSRGPRRSARAGSATSRPFPLLARLWKDCALNPVWSGAGHALFKIATPEAMAALLFVHRGS